MMTLPLAGLGLGVELGTGVGLAVGGGVGRAVGGGVGLAVGGDVGVAVAIADCCGVMVAEELAGGTSAWQAARTTHTRMTVKPSALRRK
jgi:hypothetical protein